MSRLAVADTVDQGSPPSGLGHDTAVLGRTGCDRTAAEGEAAWRVDDATDIADEEGLSSTSVERGPAVFDEDHGGVVAEVVGAVVENRLDKPAQRLGGRKAGEERAAQ